MYRQQIPVTPQLAALLDERDHLRIQISLLADADRPNPDQIEHLRARLREMETEITDLQRRSISR